MIITSALCSIKWVPVSVIFDVNEINYYCVKRIKIDLNHLSQCHELMINTL